MAIIRPVRSLSLLLGLLLSTVPTRAQAETAFAAHADRFVKRHGLGARPDAGYDLDKDVFAGRALILRVGIFDVTLMDADGAGREDFLALQQAVSALCDLQRQFIQWTLGASVPAQVDLGARAVQAWVKTWRPTTTPHELGLDKANDTVRAAAEAFTTAVSDALGLDARRRACVWLTPSRLAFAEAGAFLGTLAPENRELLWQDYLKDSSEAWASRPRVLQLIAMEYAPPEGGGDEGIRMDIREKSGLLQHVLQRCASSLCVTTFGDSIDRDFEAGLSQNLVVALLKENNARTGGSGKGAFAGARSVFVAGGASGGGSLAGINLDSQWRGTKGRDYFVKPLKLGQRAGGKATESKEARDRLGSFALAGEDGTRHVVTAPFLGPPPDGLPSVPATHVDDFKEMLRAYRSAFVRWLQEDAGKGKADSTAKFGALLRSMAGSDGRVTFELACRKVYAERLSDAGPTPVSLEWRFLQWLSR